jgi:hypothetical protein
VGATGASIRAVAGYLAGVAAGTLSITLLFLGMRAVMDVGGACADGGPYVSAQPCPEGVAAAMVGGMFGLFAAAGLILWFGSRLGGSAVAVVALGWPLLFIALGFNFLDFAFRPVAGESGPIWGWLIPGLVFWVMGAGPVVVAIAGWRGARAGRTGNRLVQQLRSGMRGSTNVFDPRPAARPTAPPGDEARIEFAPNAFGARRPAPTTESSDPRGAADLVDDLSRLAELHGSGDLTDAEFAAAKRQRLGDTGSGS